MRRSEDRAASEVLGAVIIFGFLVITFAIYQGIVIPQQNRSVEFEHNQAVQEAIQDLRNAIRQAATTGSGESVSVTLGASYPQRVLGINPGISAGSIRTESMGTLAIKNVTASQSEAADYFGSGTTTLGPFDSKALVFRPVYTHYSEAPTTRYENTLAYNQFPNGANLSITDQTVVDGRQLTLIVLTGNLSKAEQGTVSVDTHAISTASDPIAVTDDGGPINITIPTDLSAADWEDLLEEELDPTDSDPDRFVVDVKQTGPDQVSIILEQGVTYELQIAKVGIGSGSSQEEAKYLTDIEGDETSVVENGTHQLVVEVRDRFNNPVSNVSVAAQVTQSAGAGDSVTVLDSTTGADGQARIEYTAPEDVNGTQPADIEVTFDGGTDANETAVFDVRVLDADGSGGGGTGNGAYTIAWKDPSGQMGTSSCTASACTLDASQSLTLDLTMETDPTADEANVEYAVSNTSIATVSPKSDLTNSAGENTTTLTARANGTVKVYVTSGAGGDTITITVTNMPSLAFSSLTITDTSQTSNPNKAQFEVSYTVEDPNSRMKNVTVTFQNNDNSGQTDSSSSTALSDTLTYSSNPSHSGDEYTIVVELFANDGTVAQSHTCTEDADGTDGCGEIF